MNAAIAAFEHGADWLDALRFYIQGYRKAAARYIKQNILRAALVSADATYLLCLDIGQLVGTGEGAAEIIRAKTGLYLSGGGQYGKAGEQFLRINAVCPRQVLLDGLQRLAKGMTACDAYLKSRY